MNISWPLSRYRPLSEGQQKSQKTLTPPTYPPRHRQQSYKITTILFMVPCTRRIQISMHRQFSWAGRKTVVVRLIPWSTLALRH